MVRARYALLSLATAVTAASATVVIPGSPASAAVSGYWLLAGDGGVFTFGTTFAGSAASDASRCPPNTTDRSEPNGTCWSVAATPDGQGYWVLNGDTGAVYAFGDAGFFGDPAAGFAGAPRDLVPTSVAIVATPTGHGYWVLEAGLSGLGSVAAFGDAVSYGDTAHIGAPQAAAPVGLAATPDGHGYWIVDGDGAVFAFGDAGFYGSMGGRQLNRPVMGIARTTDGKGYYLVASDGGVFAFGNAVFKGSMGGVKLNAPVVGIAVDPLGGGYWLAATDGGVFSFGGAPFRGSLGATHLNRPIFAIASTANGH